MKNIKLILYHLPLPSEIITNILFYDINCVIREGKIRIINKLSKDDIRYRILEKIPLIFICKSINRKSVINSIVIYDDIINKDYFEIYLCLYNTIRIYRSI